jgi:hypothetical protein
VKHPKKDGLPFQQMLAGLWIVVKLNAVIYYERLNKIDRYPIKE